MFSPPPLPSGPSILLRLFVAVLVLTVGLAFVAVPPAEAQPVLDGFVKALRACEATPAIRSPADPGGARLAPGRTYRLLAENKAGGTHFLVVVPGASPEKRWIEQGCGERVASAAGSDTGTRDAAPSSAAAAAAAAASSAPAPAASRAERPERAAPRDRRQRGNRAIVALNWQPAFCETSGRPECRTQTADRFDASNFSLHGLWPQPRGREFCGVSARLREVDEAGDWTALPAPEVSAATRRDLDRAMPGTRSGLDRHEWYRHGTCYGADADAYFRDSLEVLAAVNASAVRALFAERVGRTLSRDEVRDAFDRSFGAGTGDRVRLTCRRDGGRNLISEITLGLAGEIRPDADLAALLLAAPEAKGGCSEGIVDAVGRQ